MTTIVYGVKSFKKVYGPKGEPKECPYCHRVYQETYVRINKWGHLEYIPLIPLGKDYYHFCPICFYGDMVDKENKKAVKKIVKDKTPATTNTAPRAYHHKLEKTWDLVVIDQNSGETFPVLTQASKSEYKETKKRRFYKKVEEFEV